MTTRGFVLAAPILALALMVSGCFQSRQEQQAEQAEAAASEAQNSAARAEDAAAKALVAAQQASVAADRAAAKVRDATRALDRASDRLEQLQQYEAAKNHRQTRHHVARAKANPPHASAAATPAAAASPAAARAPSHKAVDPASPRGGHPPTASSLRSAK